MSKNGTNQVRAKSAPLRPAEVTSRIQDGLRCLAIPANPLCEAGIALVTLENAQDVMQLIDAVESQESFEMPDGGRSALAQLRQLVQDAVKYASILCDREDNARGAADRGDETWLAESAEVSAMAVAHG